MSPHPSSTVALGPRPSSRGLRRLVGLGGVAAAGALVIGGLPLAKQAAANPATTTFTFSGTVNGTLHMADVACGGTGGQFKFEGKWLKGSKASTWTVNVNTPSTKGGTWERFTPNAAGVIAVSVVLQSHSSSREYDWITKSGKITTSSSGGAVDVTLDPDHSLSGAPGSGTVHLSGSWGCISN